jgi:hypothetical protein
MLPAMQIELIELAPDDPRSVERQRAPVADDPFLFFRGLGIAVVLSLPAWVAIVWAVAALLAQRTAP